MSGVRNTVTHLVQVGSIWHQCEPLQFQVQLPSGDLVQGKPLETKCAGSADMLLSAWSTPMEHAQPRLLPEAVSMLHKH